MGPSPAAVKVAASTSRRRRRGAAAARWWRLGARSLGRLAPCLHRLCPLGEGGQPLSPLPSPATASGSRRRRRHRGRGTWLPIHRECPVPAPGPLCRCRRPPNSTHGKGRGLTSCPFFPTGISVILGGQSCHCSHRFLPLLGTFTSGRAKKDLQRRKGKDERPRRLRRFMTDASPRKSEPAMWRPLAFSVAFDKQFLCEVKLTPEPKSYSSNSVAVWPSSGAAHRRHAPPCWSLLSFLPWVAVARREGE